MKTHTVKKESVRNKIVNVENALDKAHSALFYIHLDDLIDKMSLKEADRIVKKMKTIRKNIDFLLGQETTQKGN
jgi:uncharacterized protein Veg